SKSPSKKAPLASAWARPSSAHGRRWNQKLLTSRMIPIPMVPIKVLSSGISFAVKVHPRAKKNAITGIVGDALKLSLTSPPVEGRANAACIEFFAELFAVSRASVTIAAGETSRKKVVRVAGVSEEFVRQKLLAA